LPLTVGLLQVLGALGLRGEMALRKVIPPFLKHIFYYAYKEG
jgi:hypothetical protein